MANTKKFLIATGGTGGHIYPAIALAHQLKEALPTCDVLFVGGGLEKNNYFDKKVFPFQQVDCGTFAKKNVWDLFQTCGRIAKGVRQSRRIISEFKPHAAIGFGSFYAFPPLVAARLASFPLILHESNSIPGKVTKVLSPWAAATGVHFPSTIAHLKGKCVEVGMPLRKGFKKGSLNAAAARAFYGLSANKKTMLVFGGSQGAQTINRKVAEAFPCQWQVVHITGDASSAHEFQAYYDKKNVLACVKPFEERMDVAWQAADLAICRAGAGTIAEILEFEVPAILIPFPRAADNHQQCNAEFLVNHARGGLFIKEPDLKADGLVEAIKEMTDSTLEMMRHAMAEYKAMARKQDLCALVLSLVG